VVAHQKGDHARFSGWGWPHKNRAPTPAPSS
jgi:hypothetical protein